eukprot:13443432-Ditylum_brightwellii.AAC.2
MWVVVLEMDEESSFETDDEVMSDENLFFRMAKSDKVKYYWKFANQRDMEDEKEAIDIVKIRHEEILPDQYENLCDIMRSVDTDRLYYRTPHVFELKWVFQFKTGRGLSRPFSKFD